MQLFVRDLQGNSRSFTAASPDDLLAQVTSVLDLDPSATRLSHASRPIPLDFSSLPPHATIDVSLRLRGGGPKKRCAHVLVKTGPSPSSSGTSTPKSAPVAAAKAEEKKEEDGKQDTEMASTSGDAQKPPAPEPVVERCSSAALRLVGDCPRCEKSFCGAHRLPEDHACPALANFRKAAFDENRAKLEKEATISSKISAF